MMKTTAKPIWSGKQYRRAATIPINAAMLGIELEGYRSAQEYIANPVQQSETLYLRIADVLASPDPDMVIISTIRSELSDYGYTY